MIRTTLSLACLAFSTALSAQTTIDTAKGPVTFDAAPQSVAVYDVAAIDTLTALGIMPAGVVDNLFVDYLGDVAASAATVGSLFEPDLEALNALSPDLIIVGGRSSAQFDAVSRIGTAIDMTIDADVVGEGYARLEAYGALFGKVDEATQLRAALEADFAETRANIEGMGTAMILMTNGPEVSAYGVNGRFGWLHQALDLPSAAPIEDSNHGQAVSFEFIREANPDIIFVLDRLAAIGGEGEAADTVLDNVLMHETSAWQNGHIIYLDAAPTYIAAGGVQAMTNVLQSINAAIAAQ